MTTLCPAIQVRNMASLALNTVGAPALVDPLVRVFVPTCTSVGDNTVRTCQMAPFEARTTDLLRSVVSQVPSS